MTNEEAIKHGEEQLQIFGGTHREFILTAIKALKKRPQGEWIEQKVCNCYAKLKCSVCDRIIEPTFTYGEYSYEDIKEWYPFCHCGADMRGEK